MSSMDIGIDLGTANIMMTLGNKGIVLNEPSVVAFNKRSNQVVAVGDEAYDMIGRTPEYIVAIRPLEHGVISDDVMTQSMIREFIIKVSGKQLFKPRIIICVPSFITEVESRAVVEAAMSAGSRKVYLIEEPIAAMLGAGIDISQPVGNMVVDIGGGTTDVAVVSLSGIVVSKSIKVGGNKIDQSIIRYVTNKYKVLIGDKTAEEAKKKLTNLFEPSENETLEIKGRNLLTGLPERVTITQTDIYEAIYDNAYQIVLAVKEVLEETSPELVGDIYTNGIILTGGGAFLKGLDEVLTREIGVKAFVADDPLSCVAKGTALAFHQLDQLREGFENVSVYKYR